MRREDGFTLIEVMVAALILALSSAALFGVLAASTRNGARAKATQIALDRAQQEMEKLHSLSYDELVLTKLPQPSNNRLSPNNRVNGTNGTFALKREPQEEFAPMVREGDSLWGGGFVGKGVVKPGPIAFQSGDVKGQLYRYIVWRNDKSCPESETGEDLCPGFQDYKQLVVAVKLDSTGAEPRERNYIEVQSAALDPDSVAQAPSEGGGGKGGEGGEGGGGSAGTGTAVTAQQFFLTDTPCSASGREEITGDHLLHNTLGTCADGAQTGSTDGAPDSLLLGAPPDPAPEDETLPLLYDYASEIEPTPDTDRGVQIRTDDTSGCHFTPTGTVYPQAQTHRWVSDPFTADFKMTGKVTLELYTRTLNDALYHGTLCVFLFDRLETGVPGEAPEDGLFIDDGTGNANWEYTPEENEFWPRNAWTKVRLTMEFPSAPYTIHEDHRLGVALSVDPGNTEAEAIPIMYDHPNYPTRLEVDTTTPTQGG
jgi:prepilin-type N-terminal cleavage/methylation domain-containing protein